MRKWIRKNITRDMIRPIIYKTVSHFCWSLIPVLIWYRFFNRSAGGLSTAFVLMFLLFMFGALLAHLRMDGWHIPVLPERKVPLKESADALYGDMIDHVDEHIISFGDLDESEQHICLFVADLLCGGLYLIISFFL